MSGVPVNFVGLPKKMEDTATKKGNQKTKKSIS